jgi:hypothetical protein
MICAKNPTISEPPLYIWFLAGKLTGSGFKD